MWLSVARKLKVTQSPLWEEKRGKPTEVHTAIHIDLKSSVLEEEGKREGHGGTPASGGSWASSPACETEVKLAESFKRGGGSTLPKV